jgi:flagellar biosynthesis chaperone FliJ
MDERVKAIEKYYKSFCNSEFTSDSVSWITIRSWYVSHVGQLLSLLSEKEAQIKSLEEGIEKHRNRYVELVRQGYTFENCYSEEDEELYKLIGDKK